MKKVSIVITFMSNGVKYLPKLLASIQRQSYTNLELIIIDQTHNLKIPQYIEKNNSGLLIRVEQYNDLSGFTVNYNRGMKLAEGDLIFVLNQDTLLDEGCLRQLVKAASLDASIGCVTPKIIRIGEDQIPTGEGIIDSAGLCLNRFIRHHDRGAGEADRGQYDQPCYVFGATGAGVLFKRASLEDICIQGQYFDEDFVMGREDADLSWRLQNYGWRCLYMPKAVMYHVRTMKPGSRSQMSPSINRNAIKNRYLLLLNNISLRSYIKNLPWILARDIVVVLAVLLIERSSLGAFAYLFNNRKRLLRKRALIQEKVKFDQSKSWFKRESIEFTPPLESKS